jgi:prepilin-type N-terminal cleavage/methylation domain-containing protein
MYSKQYFTIIEEINQNKKPDYFYRSGFTLIELLVVISIISLLASIILVATNSVRSKSRDAKRLADVRQLSTALELYYNDNQTYPSALSSLTTGTTIYMAQQPSQPTPGDGTCSNPGNTTTPYTFSGGSATTYNINFCLGAATGGYVAGPHTMTPSGVK